VSEPEVPLQSQFLHHREPLPGKGAHDDNQRQAQRMLAPRAWNLGSWPEIAGAM
jgi:hypothetical protein